MRHTILVTLLLLFGAYSHAAERLPIFDAHLHYSHDAWESYPVDKVLEIAKKAGLKGALISSSDDRGQQQVVAAAPDLFHPELRPYRKRGETGSWMRDPSIIDYLERHLAEQHYVGIGEFHLYGDAADLPVPRRLVELAKQHGLHLHAHSDADAIDRLFAQWPEARILWAHAGFAEADEVRGMLAKHQNLWADLAFRSDHANGGRIDPAWKRLFLDFPERFMVGTDSFAPDRWSDVIDHANEARGWLARLPQDVAEKIAWKNAFDLLQR